MRSSPTGRKWPLWPLVALVVGLGPAPALGTDAVPFLLDWTPNHSQAYLFVAQAKGFFAEQGLEVTLDVPKHPADPIDLVAAGKYPLAIFERARTRVPEGFWRDAVECPMCVGFWVGALFATSWSDVLAFDAAHALAAHALMPRLDVFAVTRSTPFTIFLCGCASSIASALGVLAWETLRQLPPAVGLWTSNNHPDRQ